jgi:predicted RecB family nuclease
MHVVLGDGNQISLRTADVRHYYGVAQQRFVAFVGAPPATSLAEPCGHFTFCRWAKTCEAVWDESDHLSLVANVDRGQIDKLRAGGITTMHQLAAMSATARIPNMQAGVLSRLRSQAALQVARRDTGKNQHEMLPPSAGRGFDRLPKPDPGDLFFDMEGDPLYEMGLEYLFGTVHYDKGREQFTAFWAHNRADEKKAFENTIDFMAARLKAYPGAHIYHYASYEQSHLSQRVKSLS